MNATILQDHVMTEELGQHWVLGRWFIVDTDQNRLIDQSFESKGQAKRVAIQLGFTLH